MQNAIHIRKSKNVQSSTHSEAIFIASSNYESILSSVFNSQSFIKKSEKMSGNIVTKTKYKYTLLFVWGLALCLSSLFYISLPPTNATQCNCQNKSTKFNDESPPVQENAHHSSHKNDDHKLAILVPFRDRFEEVMEFAPHIHKFLNAQRKNFHLYVLNQVDNLRFNRASLLNVGFLESSIDCDYVSLHDVDLLPMNSLLVYEFPKYGPYHVAAPYLHPRYHYPTFIGGILLLTREQYRAVDGLSNKYWGWGLEDDELYARFKEAKLSVHRPKNLTTGTGFTFKHIHDRKVRKRDMIKCYNQQVITRRRDRQTGLSTTKYHIHSRKEMTIDGAPLTVINIILECDYKITPWCNCTESVGNTVKPKKLSSEDLIVPKLDRKKHLSPDG